MGNDAVREAAPQSVPARSGDPGTGRNAAVRRRRSRRPGPGPGPRLDANPGAEARDARLPAREQLAERLVVVVGPLGGEFQQVDPIQELDKLAEALVAEELRQAVVGRKLLGRLGAEGTAELYSQRLADRSGQSDQPDARRGIDGGEARDGRRPLDEPGGRRDGATRARRSARRRASRSLSPASVGTRPPGSRHGSGPRLGRGGTSPRASLPFTTDLGGPPAGRRARSAARSDRRRSSW